ncbi:carbohydrate ABC transporter permease [Gracilibacillus phocaeensis]|uniref:carbohydrate ABC transporter permease n=1 Tax=Gracilibacillus phocaeensis TaxID=2042304 RepID=UPI001030E514|nr:carbohydrate ABC transporter permease [Gracilibacillus phocaeensis]
MNKVLNSKYISYIFLIGIAILFLLPALWVIVASFDSGATLEFKFPKLTLGNYIQTITDAANQLAYFNGLYISVTVSVFTVIISVLAAYPLSRYQLKFKNTFLLTILFLTGLPIVAIMVPVYILFINMGLVNTLTGVIMFMIAGSLPYSIWLMKNFIDSVPIELEESAWIDGATALQAIRKIVVPVIVPGFFVVFIFNFVNQWGNFFIPFILLTSEEKLPIAVHIFQFFGLYGRVDYGALAAYSVLYSLPPVILYFVGQKYLSGGFTMGGATKG